MLTDYLVNFGWIGFLALVALPGLVGLIFVGSELWDTLRSDSKTS